MNVILKTLYAVRKLRTERKIGQGARLEQLVMQVANGDDLKATVEKLDVSLLGAARAESLTFGDGAFETGIDGLSIDIIPSENVS